MWRISQYRGRAAILESAEPPVDGEDDRVAAAGGPVIIPTPLGDMPLTLEILAEA